MTTRTPAFAAALSLLACAAPAEEAAPPPGPAPSVAAHALTVSLDPEKGSLEATDRMTVLRGGGGDLAFHLRTGLEIRRLEVDGKVRDSVVREEKEPWPGISRFRAAVARGPGETAAVTVAYGGVIREEVRKAKDLAFVVGDFSRGTISPEGVFLSESTGWAPNDGGMATWSVAATVPEGWTVVTQGGVPEVRTAEGRTTFASPPGIPCDGLWLQAGRWRVERRTLRNGAVAGTFLSEANAGMSRLMLDSVEEYMGLYEKVLGPYPHAKFDIVENFFTTGYGMPTATLLGGDVVQHMGVMAQRAGGKIPPGYIDHELVHCWWGNGVFVDYERGNWCEGLTSYCSNYLRKEWESREEGAKHRRGTRARFAARVRPDRDYPVRRFTGKSEDFENDIGYGKSSMVFHVARRAAGDEAFWGGIQDFARTFVGKRASWDDLRACIEKRCGRNLRTLFDQMLDRTGAPVLALAGCTASPAGDGWQVSGRVVQRSAPWWSVAVPLVVETAGGSETTTLDLAAEETSFTIRTAELPLRVLLDPDSECWRGFSGGERPAMLDATVYDPAGVECLAPAPPAGDPFAPVVEALAGKGATVCVEGPGGSFTPARAEAGTKSVLALGLLPDNPILAALLEKGEPRVRVQGGVLSVSGQRFEGEDVALLASFRAPDHPGRFVTVYGGMSAKALAAARRVFFYGGDGLVVFRAGRPVLRLEPQGDESSRAPLLDSLFPGVSADRAKALVDALCAPEVEGRLAGSPAGSKAVELLRAALEEDGLKVARWDFSFEVADWDGSPCAGLEDGSPAPEKGVPFCFSPGAPEWKAPVPLAVDADVKVETFLAGLHAALEASPGAVAVLGPAEPPAALADYLVHPSTFVPKETHGGAAAPPADLAVAGRRSRLLMPDFEVKVPVVYFGGLQRAPARVRSTATRRRIESANLLAHVPGADPALSGEAVILGAHHDHLGPGFPGANDNASGVAAAREAARALLAARGALRRPVVIVLFGAEEWGLAGSRAFLARYPGDLRIAGVLNLDTVGHGGTAEVNLVGESVHPAAAALAERCLLGAGLRRGRDIDRMAFAWGSDHYPFHLAGIPALDLYSMEYRLMHSAGDGPSTVSGEKVARVARAAAAWATAVSRGIRPR